MTIYLQTNGQFNYTLTLVSVALLNTPSDERRNPHCSCNIHKVHLNKTTLFILEGIIITGIC